MVNTTYISWFRYTHVITSIKFKLNKRGDWQRQTRNEPWHWTNDEVWVAVQSWFWVPVELMAWELSRVEHLNGIQWSWVQSHTHSSIDTSNNTSVVNTIYISSFCYTLVITSRKFQLNKRGDWRRLTRNETWYWINHEILVAVQIHLTSIHIYVDIMSTIRPSYV